LPSSQMAFDQLEGTWGARSEALDRKLLDLIARLEASLDFPEEGFHFIEPRELAPRLARALSQVNAVVSHAARGGVIREGATVVIAGRVNAGKSSLFNALIGHERAIVTDVPGTTRDFLTETIHLDRVRVTLVDTAGARETKDEVEREGVARAIRARDAADLLLVVIDSAEELTEDDHRLIDSDEGHARLVVASKCDREPKWEKTEAIRVSTTRGEGLDDLRCALRSEEQ